MSPPAARRLFVVVLSALLIGLSGTQSVRATTIVGRTLLELVNQSDRIVVTEAIDVRARRISNSSSSFIVTDVTFRVHETWKGTSGVHLLLTFAGGTIGSRVVEVMGMPTFLVGDRDVLMLRQRAESGSPLAGFVQGRLKIRRNDDGRETVLSYNGRALSTDLLQVPGLARCGEKSVGSLSLADAKRLVGSAIAREGESR